jgi:hypothetical protein
MDDSAFTTIQMANSKNEIEQTDGPNSRPFGTSGMSPADPLRGQEPCQKQAAVGHRGRWVNE